MKKNWTKLILALALGMVLVCMAGTALAADYPLWVGGVQVKDSNKACIAGSADNPTAMYDSENNTLTLNNYTTTNSHNNAAIYYNGSDTTLKLVLNGTSVITGPYAADYRGRTYGVYVENGNLLVSDGTADGTGSLTATGGYASDYASYSYGVYAEYDITVNGGSLTANSSRNPAEAQDSSISLRADNGSITINGGVTVATSNDWSIYSVPTISNDFNLC